MDKENFEAFYNIKDKNETLLWEDSLFVFDTSTLLEFYYYSDKSRKEILTKILLKLEGRLWITNHTQFEYFKNRENVYKKPFIEKYKKIENEDLVFIKNDLSSLKNRIEDFFKKTSVKDTHPFIDQTKIIKYKTKVEKMCGEYSTFELLIKKEFTKREKELKEIEKDDIIFKSFSKIFQITEEYSYEKINEIILDGERRFQHNIPPGYKDAIGSLAKTGVQKFGDLIIWKQIIDLAKSQNKDIIFVTNDVKEDWCYVSKRSNEHRIEKPREDLIKEFKDLTQKKFWMYTFSQFLYKSNELLLTRITDNSLIEVNETNRKAINDNLKIQTNGIYQTEKVDNLYWQYIKFHENGTVVTASSTDNAIDAYKGISTSNHSRPTKYYKSGSKIEFNAVSESGIVEYEIDILEDRLRALVLSRINGYIGERDYFFVEINSAPQHL